MTMWGRADSEYQCTLTPGTLAKAGRELREDPDTRLLEVKTLRKRVEKIPGLKSRTDLEFLLAVLRAAKFDQERAYQSVKRHYEVRSDVSVFADLKPTRVRHFLEQGLMEVLEERNRDGCRVVILRGGRWEPGRYPVDDVIKLVYLILMQVSKEEESQVHGVHLIATLADTCWRHVADVTPSTARKGLLMIQEAIPIRLKRVDFTDEPGYFAAFFALIKQFMKDKLLKRITMHGDKLNKLHDVISPDFLPTDLGGKLPLCSNKKWTENFLSSDSLYEEDNKYGYVNMALNSEQTTSRSGDAGIEGLGGTFRKLDV
ncbi:alpha-tocopherol transfer protein-like [Aplysia californica]|uniref:Alpha-tocopherol transfer protein-like n=1 Tax=Aplysia californica TaxID=6500 RepID=A0ABM1A1Q6_APLCA|nr:alpha-tocopherol transfer protein-like [Aplysia californica]